MRILIQRVMNASVQVNNNEVSKIDRGYLLFVGIHEHDTESEVKWLASKTSGLRLFEDADGKFNHSIQETMGEVLVVSQFTLYGDARKGRRPSFSHAAPPEKAEPLCKLFADLLREGNLTVKEGVFGAQMQVSLVNDGPVTIMLEREPGS
ncbi:MAG: D-aminoacyl-tRNA deacylase [Candidatus Electryonea clarkiae]|nr:D-aminoacyl-tRNA deacylase [Candidatus Electryonea clarkiae]MDP8287810.1 D-aminoacyl-tRNA deacylase [Candidatus Electryonea clarkiae]